jgi:hypothetical protein
VKRSFVLLSLIFIFTALLSAFPDGKWTEYQVKASSDVRYYLTSENGSITINLISDLQVRHSGWRISTGEEAVYSVMSEEETPFGTIIAYLLTDDGDKAIIEYYPRQDRVVVEEQNQIFLNIEEADRRLQELLDMGLGDVIEARAGVKEKIESGESINGLELAKAGYIYPRDAEDREYTIESHQDVMQQLPGALTADGIMYLLPLLR